MATVQRLDKGLYHAIIAQQNCESVRNLVRDSPHSLKTLTPNGDTSLHLAGSVGNVDIMNELLSLKPFMLLTINGKGETVLHKVVAARHKETVNFLLSRPSQLEFACDLEAGAQSVHTQSIWLDGNNENGTGLHYTAKCGDAEIAGALLEKVQGIAFICNNAKEPPVYTACEEGHSDVAMKILHADSSASVPDSRGDARTCLHSLIDLFSPVNKFLIEKKRNQIMENAKLLIIERNQLVEKSDGSSNLPLHLATMYGELQLVLLKMVTLSARNVNVMNEDGNTFLDLIDMKRWFHHFTVFLAPFLHTTDLISKRGEKKLQKRNDNNIVGSNSQMADEALQKQNETLSLIVVLLTTVSYAVAFTIPGGFDSKSGIPVLMHAPALKVFIISDALSMCLSMGALFTLLFVPVATSLLAGPLQRGGREQLETSSSLGACLIVHALVPTVVSFGTGVYVMVATKIILFINKR
ncbi:hypothetical protein KI387_010388 [Taxus chinensis]|uniref:PGG domain-containing protein n=1 Tax=Taxus chinensis TaxID=29808 RepID=A0AA38FKZ4_TAXCH|nr:hypothetical protein KI387_010388 [Taxus chinensis]